MSHQDVFILIGLLNLFAAAMNILAAAVIKNLFVRIMSGLMAIWSFSIFVRAFAHAM